MRGNKINLIDEYKKKMDDFSPLRQHIFEQIKAHYKIKLTHTSNAIEGNSLTLIDTKIIIEDFIAIGGKLIRENLEVLWHSEAYDFLFKSLNNFHITEQDLLI